MTRPSVATAAALPQDASCDPALRCEVTKRDLSSYLGAAVDSGLITIDELAYLWGVHRSYVQRVIGDVKPLADYRIKPLPAHVQRFMHEQWGNDLGVLVGRKAAIGMALEGLTYLAAETEPSYDARLDAVRPAPAKAGMR